MQPAHPSMTELYRGKFLGLHQTGTWEYCSRTNAHAVVVVVALNDRHEFVLTEQFRPPLGCSVIEFPAGLAGDEPGLSDEPLAEAAARELEEEVGYRAQSMTALTSGPTSAGLTDEVIHFFQANNPERVGAGGGVGGENIIVHHVHRTEIHGWLEDQQRRGLMVDPKVYAGLYFVMR